MKHDAATSLGEVLRGRRTEMGLSVQEAAKRCGYSRVQWTKFETGQTVPPFEKLEMIASQLEIAFEGLVQAWAQELEPSRAPKLRELLTALGSDEDSSSRLSLHEAEHELREIAVDGDSRELASSLLRMILRYRQSLTASKGTSRDFRITDALGELRLTTPIETVNVHQQGVGASRVGLGYSATVIRIEPGHGAYHRHCRHRYVDSGTEFFSVHGGDGYLVTEKPKSKIGKARRKGGPNRWRADPVRAGIVGLYRGELGHAWIGTGPAPLLFYVVCVPFPPDLTPLRKGAKRQTRGRAEAVEFQLAELRESALPAALRTCIESLELT